MAVRVRRLKMVWQIILTAALLFSGAMLFWAAHELKRRRLQGRD